MRRALELLHDKGTSLTVLTLKLLFDHHHHHSLMAAAASASFFGNRILIRARVRSSEFGLEMEGENPIRNVNMSLIAMALQKTSFDLTKG